MLNRIPPTKGLGKRMPVRSKPAVDDESADLHLRVDEGGDGVGESDISARNNFGWGFDAQKRLNRGFDGPDEESSEEAGVGWAPPGVAGAAGGGDGWLHGLQVGAIGTGKMVETEGDAPLRGRSPPSPKRLVEGAD